MLQIEGIINKSRGFLSYISQLKFKSFSLGTSLRKVFSSAPALSYIIGPYWSPIRSRPMVVQIRLMMIPIMR